MIMAAVIGLVVELMWNTLSELAVTPASSCNPPAAAPGVMLSECYATTVRCNTVVAFGRCALFWALIGVRPNKK